MEKITEENKTGSGQPTRFSYKLVNNVTGWVAFFVAAVTYLLTLEPTTSLWDCGEFITTAAGLQVGHPPGAPLFMILGRVFAVFSPDASKIAYMINVLSGLASAATILFLFWSITHLAKKLVVKSGEVCTTGQLIAIMGAGLVGSLCYTFTDTFWFSAVEGEVYALSSLFTAAVFWAILRWEEVADEPFANRWLVLIAYLMGLSIGVHLLNLLAIPAIVFVYYFKKYKPSTVGVIKTGAISLVILGFINFMLIPGVIKIAGWFELLFTNSFGLPFNTGVAFYVILLIAGMVWGIRYTIHKNMAIWNTILTCFLVIMIGYSSYSMIVIRSISNPPIDENSPDNVFSLLSYIQRDQYGQSPLFFGQYYNAPLIAVEDGEPMYYQNHTTGKYDKIGNKPIYKYDPRFQTFFPRMHGATRSGMDQVYEMWGGPSTGPSFDVNGEMIQRPGFGNNLRYFFSYQLGHMYWRYFMWNFAGRQNDTQGHGGIRNGNWISGINFLDEMRLGNQSEITDSMKNAPARNKYYLLPLILGILGMIFQYRKGLKGKEDFWVVMFLFFLTGIAIILYLNQMPMEPRERDYAYAGSFYAFAIWVGLGTLWLWELLNKRLNGNVSAILATAICLVLVPANMAAQNWDDHDRSGRYATLAHAMNYLNSCAPNAILFTYGDNDTFPLWYAQEVEGIRRDVRVVNLSLLAGDWYIDQTSRKVYDNEPVKISFTKDQYHAGVRDQVGIMERYESADLKQALEFVASDLPQTKLRGYKEPIDYMPTRTVTIPVDSATVVNNGTVQIADADSILKQLSVNLKGNYLNKSQLMVLDIIAQNNWERPVYFGVGMGSDAFMGLDKYFQLEGAAYRLVPIENKGHSPYEVGRINTDVLYDNMMNDFVWGNINNEDVLIDHFHDNTIAIMKYRTTFLRLSEQLYVEGQTDKAIAALDKSLQELPINKVPMSNELLNYIAMYYELGEYEKGNELARAFVKENEQNIRYIASLAPSRIQSQEIQREYSISRQVIKMILDMAQKANQKQLVDEINIQVRGMI
ncbi:MAG: protein O-mannosyl-transferase family [Marinifilaceae bacterium]